MMREPKALLTRFENVCAGDNVCYILSPERTITRTNPTWETFARANDGAEILEKWSVGADALAPCAPWLRSFYADAFAHACATGGQWAHEYECSSPDMYRRFLMIVYPYEDWLLVTHALVVEHKHPVEPLAPLSEYDDHGLIFMCMHCRRTRRASNYERWDWVPGFVAKRPPRVSHGLCPTCFDFYYEALQ